MLERVLILTLAFYVSNENQAPLQFHEFKLAS